MHTKTETWRHNKSSSSSSARLGSVRLPLRQLLRDFQSSHLPEPVRVHIAFLHLMASAPSVLMSDAAATTAAAAAARGEKEGRNKLNKPKVSLPLGVCACVWMEDDDAHPLTCNEVCECLRMRTAGCTYKCLSQEGSRSTQSTHGAAL